MYLNPILSNVPTKCIYIRYYRMCLQNVSISDIIERAYKMTPHVHHFYIFLLYLTNTMKQRIKLTVL